MLAEACYVWNHTITLQRRYYRIYGGYIPLYRMYKHQSKTFKGNTLVVSTIREIIKKVDAGYQSFFKKQSSRPPKYKKINDYCSIIFCKNSPLGVDNCCFYGNKIRFRRINKTFKYFNSRNYEGEIKRVIIKRSKQGEYFIYIVTDAEPKKYGKSRNGASVGIDFGLKTYLTLSDGTRYENPQFMKKSMVLLRKTDRRISKKQKNSKNKIRELLKYERIWELIRNKRECFQWNLAHELCRKYDTIFIEDLDIVSMKKGKNFNRKLLDLSHSSFISKLEHIAKKYDVTIHKIDRYYPSSKTCTCGYVNKDLKLTDRTWTCPHCGATHDRDLLAANNILRRGIYELESDSKTKKHSADGQLRYYPTITRIIA